MRLHVVCLAHHHVWHLWPAPAPETHTRPPDFAPPREVNHPRRQRLVLHIRGDRGGGRGGDAGGGRQLIGTAETRTEGLSEEEPERDELGKHGDEGDDQLERATPASGTWVIFRLWSAVESLA